MKKKIIKHNINQKTLEILAVLCFYLFFSVAYHALIQYIGLNSNDSLNKFWRGLFNLKKYWYSSGMQYLLFFLGSVLIWLVVIKPGKSSKKKYQIFLVLILIPVIVYLVRELRYAIMDNSQLYRLQGRSTIWDLYIPYLFLMFQFGCYFAYKYYKDAQNKLKNQNELRQAALKSELAALKAQINPHFLYNVFNTINASIPSQMENTREMVAKLADLFRYQLQASKVDFIPLGDEINFIKKYLELEKARFEDRLTVNINVDEELMHIPIPPMIIQPLIENSLKHGLSSFIEGGKILVEISKKENQLVFIIADTGIGIQEKQSLFNRGTGLRNTKLRLEKIYNSSLIIENNNPRGLKVLFTIRLDQLKD